jgi:hypothetical protein
VLRVPQAITGRVDVFTHGQNLRLREIVAVWFSGPLFERSEKPLD